MKKYKDILYAIFVFITVFGALIGICILRSDLLGYTFLFSFFIIVLPSSIFRNIVMGSEKRAIHDQLCTDVKRMFLTIAEIAYDDWEEIRISSELLNSKINLGNNQIFIKRQTKLYFEARRYFEDYVNKFNLNSEGVLINKSLNNEAVIEAQILAAKLSDISDAIFW